MEKRGIIVLFMIIRKKITLYRYETIFFACCRHIWGLMTKIQYCIESSGRGGDFEVLIVQFGPLGLKL